MYPFFRALLLALMLAVTALPRPAAAAEASLRLEPATATVPDASPFLVDIVLGSGNLPISALSATLSFDPAALEVRAAEPVALPGAFWSRLPVVTGDGSLTFAYTVDPPLVGDAIRMVRLTLARRSGNALATLRFIAGAALVAGEEGGTNVLASGMDGVYVRPAPTLTASEAPTPGLSAPEESPESVPQETLPTPRAPRVSSPTHPVDSLRATDAAWVSTRAVEFNWSAEPSARGFSYVLDHEPATMPDTTPEGPQTAAVFADVADGIWTFHVRAESAGGWGDAAHYGVRIDATPPSACEASHSEGEGDVFRVRASATDALSGIAEYAVEIAAGSARKVLPAEMASGVSLDIAHEGGNAVKVTVRDRAGNRCDAFVRIPGRMPTPLAISVSPSRLVLGKPCYAEGTAPAGAYIALAIAPEGEEPRGRSVPRVRADLEGRWAGLCGSPETAGRWRLFARLDAGEQGQLRIDEVVSTFAVEEPVVPPEPSPTLQARELPAESSDTFPVLAAALIPLGVLLCGALALVMIWRRQDRVLHTHVGAAAAEAELVLRVGKESLRAEIVAAAAALNALAERRTLTPEEHARKNTLADALMSLEAASVRRSAAASIARAAVEPPKTP